MHGFICLILDGILVFTIGMITMSEMTTYKSDIAVKLANVVNASMLDCITKNIITKKQVNEIELVFQKYIEANFKDIKATNQKNEEFFKNENFRVYWATTRHAK